MEISFTQRLETICRDKNNSLCIGLDIDPDKFPSGMDTPNGIAVGPNEKIWIADTSGNFFFSFDPEIEKFTKYVTSIPHEDSYGNLKLPTYSSNPYWIELLDEKEALNDAL